MTFPITITELALERMLAARRADEGVNDGYGIRVSVEGGGCSGMIQKLIFSDEIDETDLTVELEQNGEKITIMVDEFSILYLNGAEIDYEIGEFKEGFKFNNASNVKNTCACGSSVSY